MDRYRDRYDDARFARPGRKYAVAHAVETGVVGAANDIVGALWNPSGTRSIWATYFKFDRLSQGNVDSDNGLARITTRGSGQTTITPDATNDFEAELAPQSGAVLEYSHVTTMPTLGSPRISGNYYPVSATSGWSSEWIFVDGLRVPPGTGLAFYRINGGGNMQGYLSFEFEE